MGRNRKKNGLSLKRSQHSRFIHGSFFCTTLILTCVHVCHALSTYKPMHVSQRALTDIPASVTDRGPLSMPLTSKPSPLFTTYCSLFSQKSFLTTYISLTLLVYDFGECSMREDLTQSVIRVWEKGAFWPGSWQCGPQCFLNAPSWGQQKGAHGLGSRAEPEQAQPGISSYQLQPHTLSESHCLPSRLKVLCHLVSGSPGPGDMARSGKAHLIVPVKREMAYWAASLNSFTGWASEGPEMELI